MGSGVSVPSVLLLGKQRTRLEFRRAVDAYVLAEYLDAVYCCTSRYAYVYMYLRTRIGGEFPAAVAPPLLVLLFGSALFLVDGVLNKS